MTHTLIFKNISKYVYICIYLYPPLAFSDNGSIIMYCILFSVMPLLLKYLQYTVEMNIINFIVQRILYKELWNILTYMNMELSLKVSVEKRLWRVIFLSYSNTQGHTVLWAYAKEVEFSFLTCLVGKPYQWEPVFRFSLIFIWLHIL